MFTLWSFCYICRKSKETFAMKRFCILVMAFAVYGWGHSQNSAYYQPVNFKKAYQSGTRDWTGKPGENYWQNRADYQISVEVFPDSRKVSGTEEITYYNNSPDTMKYLVFHLFPNVYKKGQARDFEIDFSDETDGVKIENLIVAGEKFEYPEHNPFVKFTGSNMMLYLRNDLLPGKKIKLELDWNYQLNRNSHYREGAVDETTFFVAYFFPRIAVYDDIDGWNRWEYTGTIEFYNDFADFEVSVTVPGNYFVWATGLWQNPEMLLNTGYLELYQASFASDEVIKIIQPGDVPYNNKVLKKNEKNTWKFAAENVTDFVFGISDHYVWDALSVEVEPETGRRVSVNAAYNQDSEDFHQVAQMARDAISLMSSDFPGIPFPYPKMTVFNGLSEMEYPMMVNDLSMPNNTEAVKLTVHEVFHTYYPFLTGLNENKYAWMDEGLTSFAESVLVQKMDTTKYEGFYFLKTYKSMIGHDLDMPLFAISEYLKLPVYYTNSYPKAAVFFSILMDYLGEIKFKKCLTAFTERWQGKHPTPYDLFFTFGNVAGEDLSWLIKPWFFEYGYIDFSLGEIKKGKDQTTVRINRLGHYPAPVELKVIYNDNSSELFHKNAGIWKTGNDFYEISFSAKKAVKTLELINCTGLDADASNDKMMIK